MVFEFLKISFVKLFLSVSNNKFSIFLLHMTPIFFKTRFECLSESAQ